MANRLPLVVVATACEKVLHEKDNVLSVIRIVNQFKLSKLPDNLPHDAAFPIQALIGLRSGDESVVSGDVSLRTRKPNGETKDSPEKYPVRFARPDDASNLILTLHFKMREFGQYWIDVLWNGDFLTSIPIKIEESPSEPSPEHEPQPSK